MHVGPGDAGGVGGQDDGAVHLGQLREALRGELRVEEEAAGADGEDGRVVARPGSARRAWLAGSGRGPLATPCPGAISARRLVQRLAGAGRRPLRNRTRDPVDSPAAVTSRPACRSPACSPTARSPRQQWSTRITAMACTVERRGGNKCPSEADTGRASASRRSRQGLCGPPRPIRPPRRRPGPRARRGPVTADVTASASGEIGCRLGGADAARGRDEDLGGGRIDRGATREARPAAGDRRRGRCPNVCRPRPPSATRAGSACTSTRSGRRPCCNGVTMLPGTPTMRSPSMQWAGVRHVLQSLVAHFEDPHLAGRAEPVLDRRSTRNA